MNFAKVKIFLKYNSFMNVKDEYVVKIEKLTNLGLGLVKIDGFVVFAENGCPGDTVRISITKVTKNYANAKILEIIEDSPHRIKPVCPMQKICGACQIQFIDYDYQLELKQQIVRETIEKIGNITIEIPRPIPSPQIVEFRHKIQYPISQTKNSKRILAGYYKAASHEIINIKYCPIQPKICDTIIDFIRNNCSKFNIDGYIEKTHKGLLRHVVIRNSAYNNQNLVVLVVNETKLNVNLKNFCEYIFNEFPQVSGVCINFNNKKTNVIMGNKTECIVGTDFIEEKVLDKIFHIGAKTFFQVNPKSAENIFAYVKKYLSDNFANPTVLDAYSGISAFGICVSDVCSRVVCVEENSQSVDLARECLELNNIRNVETNCQDAGEFLRNETRKFDAIILDPPRKGCSKDSLDASLRLGNTIIYVSCNPATLARDLKYLEEQGAKVESVQPFDMFCHSYHIENVAIIKNG